ncbi:MAG TPA: biopolymer transporter ExbD [Burkholderiaceae bacterium]
MDFRKGRAREELEINLIPFIDVLLVILIFMMVTTTYSKFTSLHIQLPTEDGDRTKEQIVRIHVAVDAHGHYAINDQVVTATDAASLKAELKRVADEKGLKDPDLVIDADAMATHQAVMNVLKAAGDVGFDKVTFTTQESDGKK